MSRQQTVREIFKPKFFDQHGNLKTHSSQGKEGSENPSVPNNVAAIMADKLGLNIDEVLPIAELNAAKRFTNGGKYFTKENDLAKYKQELKDATCFDSIKMRLGILRSSNRFSHDETNGVASGSFYGMTKEMGGPTKALHTANLYAINENTKQTFYRPYDVGAATQYAKRFHREQYQGSVHHLVAQIELFASHACSNTDTDANGNYVTSGKQQAWLRVNGLRLTQVHNRMTLQLPEVGGWREVWSHFYTEEDYPINIMARMLYA